MSVIQELFMKRAAVLHEMLVIASDIATVGADSEKAFVAKYMEWCKLRDQLDGGIR